MNETLLLFSQINLVDDIWPLGCMALLSLPFLWSLWVIRKAQCDQPRKPLEEDRFQELLAKFKASEKSAKWPKLIVYSAVLTIFALTAGWTHGEFIWVSGFILIAMDLATRFKQLQKAQIVDRSVFDSEIKPTFFNVVGLIYSSYFVGFRIPAFSLTDPHLVCAMFLLAGVACGAQQVIKEIACGKKYKFGRLALYAISVIGCLSPIWSCSKTLWSEIKEPELIRFVEGFTGEGDNSYLYECRSQCWGGVSRWLKHCNVNPNFSKQINYVKTHVSYYKTIHNTQTHTLIANMVYMDLLPREVIELLSSDVKKNETHLAGDMRNDFYYGNFHRFTFNSIAIAKETGVLTAETSAAIDQEYQKFNSVQQTEPTGMPTISDLHALAFLAKRYGDDDNIEACRQMVHRLLPLRQSRNAFFRSDGGGFFDSDIKWMRSSMPIATVKAVELMELFGVPEGVDIDLLRSFLKPQVYEGFSIRVLSKYDRHADECLRVATLARLESLSGIKPLGWAKRIWYERNLICAILTTFTYLLAIFGTPRLPKIRNSETNSKSPDSDEIPEIRE